MRRRVLLALFLLAGCGLVPNASPFKNQLSQTVTFEQPASFDNPAAGSGYFGGSWQVKDGSYQQAQSSINNFITIRRYKGGGWGSNGEAPAHYRTDVEIRAYQEADSPQLLGYPVGILSFIPYFRDATHYVVLVATPTNTGGTKVEAWAVNGYAPGGSSWPEEACLVSKWLDAPMSVGTPLVLGAEVDTKTQSLKVSINGEEQEKVHTPLLSGGKHWVALVSNGNYVQFDNLRLFK